MEEKPQSKPRGFTLFSDEGKSFSLRKELIAEPIQPQAKNWEEICSEFLISNEPLDNFKFDSLFRSKTGSSYGRYNKNVFSERLRMNKEKDTKIDQGRGPRKEVEHDAHKAMYLRKAAIAEAKSLRRRAKM